MPQTLKKTQGELNVRVKVCACLFFKGAYSPMNLTINLLIKNAPFKTFINTSNKMITCVLSFHCKHSTKITTTMQP